MEPRHLTDETLAGLCDGTLTEEARLAAAEHLSLCDACLQRYTKLLSQQPLLVPPESCLPTIHHRLLRRRAGVMTSRYATAAAAVALALTLVWADLPTLEEILPPSAPLAQRWEELTEAVQAYFPGRDDPGYGGTIK